MTHSMKVLFVCTGNICRSPTAEAVFREILVREGKDADIYVDSAGTHGYHIGSPPDFRAVAEAGKRGIDMSDLCARRVSAQDFMHFDYIFAMDAGHMRLLRKGFPPRSKARLLMFTDVYEEGKARDIPDPYYGDAADFETAFGEISEGAEEIYAFLCGRLSSKNGKKAEGAV